MTRQLDAALETVRSMGRFTAHVQIFDKDHNEETGGEWARAAVHEYLDSLPPVATAWFQNRAAELNDEDHDQAQAERWRKVEEWCHATARDVGTKGWKNPSGASVNVEIYRQEI